MGLQLYVTQPNISRSHCGSQIEERAAVPGGPIRVWGEAALSDRRWRGTRPCRPDGHSPGVAWWKDSWLRDQTRLSSNPGLQFTLQVLLPAQRLPGNPVGSRT